MPVGEEESIPLLWVVSGQARRCTTYNACMWAARFLQVCILGSVGYAFPRFLVGLGVPLDDWANAAGKALNSPAVNFDSVLWGFVLVFTLSMFWIEGRYNILEKAFYAARPVRLSDDATRSLVELLERADALIGEATNVNSVADDWRERVIQWNTLVEDGVRSNLPPSELLSYRSVNIMPRGENQPFVNLLNFLTGRRNKLRNMTMRLLSPRWTRLP